MTATAQLIEIATRHQVYLERLKTGEANNFAAFLQRIDKSIRDRLLGQDLTDYTRSRLTRLLASTEGALHKIYDDYQEQLNVNLIELAQYEAGFEARAMGGVIDGVEVVVPTDNQIITAVMSRPLSVRGTDGGKLLEPFIKDWSAKEVQRTVGAIQQGFYEGQTTTQIVQAIRGTRKANYSDGILAITSRNARAVTHTAVQHASSQARQMTWERNPDLVQGVRWVSTLDTKTSQQCRSLDGRIFPVDKGPRPPIHINCRSSTAPKLPAEFDIFDEGATRASVGPNGGGQVPAGQTYYDWLKQQPRAFVETAIGKQRAKLFLDGGLSAERFAELNLGRNFQPLTLAEMKRLEPVAFEKAFAATPGTAGKAIKAKPKPAPVQSSIAFQEFTNPKDAAKWAVDNGIVDRADYGKLSATVANETNRSLYEHLRDYPELKGSFSFVGSAQVKNRAIYEAQLVYYREQALRRFPDMDPDRLAKMWAKKPRTSGEWAHAMGKSQHATLQGWDGIAWNENFGNEKKLAALQASLKRNVVSKFHPIGGDTIKSIMDHEMGHQIDYLLDIRYDDEIKAMYSQWKRAGADENALSRYASKSIAEFIAEGWAEYRNNPKPREIAQKIGDIIHDRYQKRFNP